MKPTPSTRWLAWLAPLLLALTACAPATRVVLLPQPDVASAAVTVQSRTAQVVLAQPYAVAEVRDSGAVEQTQTNAEEVRQRYDQLLSVQPAAAQRFTLYFQPGGAQLTPESSAELAEVLAHATERPGGEVVVIGHTDRVGAAEANDALSLQRAQAVRQLVVERGFEPARVEAVGRGERQPLVATADDVAEPRNRRAEIVVK